MPSFEIMNTNQVILIMGFLLDFNKSYLLENKTLRKLSIKFAKLRKSWGFVNHMIIGTFTQNYLVLNLRNNRVQSMYFNPNIIFLLKIMKNY